MCEFDKHKCRSAVFEDPLAMSNEYIIHLPRTNKLHNSNAGRLSPFILKKKILRTICLWYIIAHFQG